ncbi:MAG: tRNA (guanosine(46)-N7)-methyltransferase TrmB [Anaeromicrobium sp.]|jgi:tRNA (guanine-N7-)-methyltransferase|uniref:tRNA (guanosine(46)-N7)-methyltransferase TrmB n=1 Tax=Anaeromicrobium sp. TaxID=1929132 RepID=UPI0025E90348|nr:tRNA (guanosine(46)-N7)-methyltransferase TrmB [Anaeromicrobium sp.]MCT4596133.1 tRNA (guanosine(46)-N7)-methyltransferase TrmB [Anaeromicrobium sp.]
MRRRKKKGADLKLLSYEEYVVVNAEEYKGRWREYFGNDNPIYVEIGTGRGQFITTWAKNNPHINFIAMEMKEEVLLKAVEKSHGSGSKNIAFLWKDANRLEEYFNENELSRIFINFCDPWPKKRWAKRRLTHHRFLNMYKNLLKEDGEVHFKTDNERLFEFSLNEFAGADWKLKNISLDLHNSELTENITTEYEDKFVAQGLKIYRLEGLPK